MQENTKITMKRGLLLSGNIQYIDSVNNMVPVTELNI